jgi:hypothetical protein
LAILFQLELLALIILVDYTVAVVLGIMLLGALDTDARQMARWIMIFKWVAFQYHLIFQLE